MQTDAHYKHDLAIKTFAGCALVSDALGSLTLWQHFEKTGGVVLWTFPLLIMYQYVCMCIFLYIHVLDGDIILYSMLNNKQSLFGHPQRD